MVHGGFGSKKQSKQATVAGILNRSHASTDVDTIVFSGLTT